MATTTRSPAAASRRRPDAETLCVLGGTAAALVLMAIAALIPGVAGWDVHLLTVPPLHADWDVRVGAGTVPALLLAAGGVWLGFEAARTPPWSRLLALSYGSGLAWMVSLATVDGWSGIGRVLDTQNEYLDTARDVTSVSHTLHEFTSRIPLDSADNWPVHVAGHPPGALLFFVALVAVGLGSGLAAGWVVVLISASTPVAVLITLRTLGAEEEARRAAPFLVLAPAAVWMAVSADAAFAALAAWAASALASAATSRSRRTLIGWGIASGVLFGCSLMMSYGLVLLAVLVLAVLLAAQRWTPLPWAASGVAAIVLGFATAGFTWWQAYPVLRERYWDGIAQVRPFSYWVWADVAALCFCAGPVVGAAVALVGYRVARRWRGDRLRDSGAGSSASTVSLLVLAGASMVALADASAMSKAEVERIWLPFVPWLLVGTAFLPQRWRRPALGLQLVTALLVQHLLFTNW